MTDIKLVVVSDDLNTQIVKFLIQYLGEFCLTLFQNDGRCFQKSGSMNGQDFNLNIYDTRGPIYGRDEAKRILFSHTKIFIFLFDFNVQQSIDGFTKTISEAMSNSQNDSYALVVGLNPNKDVTTIHNKIFQENPKFYYFYTPLNNQDRINNIFQNAISLALFDTPIPYVSPYPSAFFDPFLSFTKVKEFIKNSCVIAQGSQQENSNLLSLPNEMLLQILVETGKDLCDEKDEKNLIILASLILGFIQERNLKIWTSPFEVIQPALEKNYSHSQVSILHI